jgi:serine protease Do
MTMKRRKYARKQGVAMFRVLVALLALLAVSPSPAQEPKEKSLTQKSPRAPDEADAEQMLAAVVRVKMKAIPDARSNRNLGPNREGTGVVIDALGHIVTIGYIVIEAESIEVTTQDNKTVPASLVGYDHASGFGLLRSGAPLGVKPMPMGRAADLDLREPVMILPAGGRESASIAYVISKRKFSAGWEYLLESAIFTAPPTLQWAGAALVSREGKLVGIGSLLVRETLEDGSQVPGNMFVPIDLLKPILADLIKKGRRNEPARPWLGLATEELHGHLVVTRVSPEGPADKAGVRNGDIVVGVGADAVKTQEEFYRRVWGLGAAGIEVPLRILQGVEVGEVRLRSIDRFQYFREKAVY